MLSNLTVGGADSRRTESGEGRVGTNSMGVGSFPKEGRMDTLLKTFETSSL